MFFLRDDEGLGQPAAGDGTILRLLVTSDNGDDTLGTWHLGLQVCIVWDHHELG